MTGRGSTSDVSRASCAERGTRRSIYFSPEHETFRTSVRNFLKAEVLPRADAWEDARSVPRDAWKQFGQQGLLGLSYPRRLGGQELDLFYSIVFLEELGRTGYGGVRASVSLHAYMATHYLAKHANAALQDAYLAPSITGDKVGALAITEQDAGSDLSRLAATARQVGDRFVVDGTKVFITNGMNADYYVVAVRTTPLEQPSRRANTGISLVLVDADSPGVTRTPQEKIGWHSAATAELHFEAVEIPAGHVIGRTNSGFSYLMRGFQLERLVAAVLALGGVDRCIESTLDYVTSRIAFDGKLSDLQSIRHRFADLATDLASARALAYHAAWAYENDELSVNECSMAKLKATELGCRAAEMCLQLQGARGYLAESEIARAYRDARAAALAGGASDVMRDIVAQQIIDLRSIP